MKTLVLLRHGRSQWNKENRFTGWTDIDLAEEGVLEAQKAGQLLKEKGFTFDMAFSSYLKRAIRTMWIALLEMDLAWIPSIKDWHLNERHYGTLQGLNKAEMKEKMGEEQVFLWRRSYDIAPPAIEESDPRHSSHEARYIGLSAEELPETESLKDTVERVVPYYESKIVPELKAGKKVLLVAHGNSLRALVKHLDQMSEQAVTELNIPTGAPLIYELDDNLKPLRSYYLEENSSNV